MSIGRLLLLSACFFAALAACALPAPHVPEEFHADLRRAGRECPGVSPKLLGAQLYQESGFDPEAVSSAGAKGIAQFMPETWQRWGADLDGDGSADPFDPAEAIDAQARLMCYLVTQADASGIDESPVVLALAAYNAGWGAVVQHGGVPPFPETREYVDAILSLREQIELPRVD